VGRTFPCEFYHRARKRGSKSQYITPYESSNGLERGALYCGLTAPGLSFYSIVPGCHGLGLPTGNESGEFVPSSYKIDKERRLVLSSATGILTKEDIFGYMDRLSKDADFDPEFSQVSDFTQVTRLDIEPEDIRQLAQRNVFSPRSHRAFVVKDDLQYGLARMFQIHRELRGEGGIRVFRTFEEALDWILSGHAAS
jgi:hypothetical protein